MEFLITRASDYFLENAPCRGAVYIGRYKQGEKVYSMQIDTLEELLELQGDVGQIIIDKNPDNHIQITIND